MKKLIKKALCEAVRVFVTSLLAAIGLNSVGCIACGDASNASFVSETKLN